MSAAEKIEDNELHEMLTAEQVLELIPVSRPTLFRWEKDKLFPQGQMITAHRKLWFRRDIVAWQKDIQDPDSPLSKAVREKLQRKPKTNNE